MRRERRLPGPPHVDEDDPNASRLAPESSPELTLDPASRRAHAAGGAPAAARSPLDVYFVIDSSESMDPAIDGVNAAAKRIVLPARRHAAIDAWFGVGTYNDRYDTRYERRLDLERPGRRCRARSTASSPGAARRSRSAPR